MSITIDDMKMPKSCTACPFEHNGDCYGGKPKRIKDIEDFKGSRHPDCPLIEASPVKHGRWVPCSERLPEYMTQVLVQLTHTGDIFVGALVPNVEGTYTMWDLPNFSSYICLEDVTAWMPLPKPYSEVEE